MKTVSIIILFVILGFGGGLYYSNTVSGNKVDNINELENSKIYVANLMNKALLMRDSSKQYLISGDANDLVTYEKYVNNNYTMLRKLPKSFTQNQRNILYEAKMSLDIWRDKYLEKNSVVRQKMINSKYTMTDILNKVEKKEGKRYIDIFRIKIKDFIDTEKYLLSNREDEYKNILDINSKISSKLIKENVDLVNHTNEIIIDANNLLIYVLDMETGMRGFLLTGDDSFLEPYNKGSKKFFELIKKLSKKVSDNKSQVSVLKTIDSFIKDWDSKVVQKSIELRIKVGDIKSLDIIINMITSEDEEKLFNNYKSKLDNLVNEIKK